MPCAIPSKMASKFMPITEALYGVLFEGKKVDDAVESLMARVKTHEMEDLVNMFENQTK